MRQLHCWRIWVVLSRVANLAGVAGLGLSVLSLSCGESKPKTNPFDTKKETVTPPAITAPPKLEGPPDFIVNADGPKIGWTYILLDKPEGKQKLTDEIEKNKKFISGETVKVRVDRKAKIAHVGAFLEALAAGGATALTVTTETRTEFPQSVTFAPPSAGKSAPTCSVVAKVLSERRNAVWSLSGGTAVRSPKGLAGPDMAMTQDSLANAAHRCKTGDFVFVSGDADVEWGLIYDLAAASQSLEKTKFSKVILLEPAPTAGRPVKLG